MSRTLGATMEKKDPKAWDRLHIIGKEIARDWKLKKPSWQVVSESRREYVLNRCQEHYRRLADFKGISKEEFKSRIK